MKKKVILFLLPVLMILLAFSPSPFEGTIKYAVETSGGNLGAFASLMPKQLDYSFKNEDLKLKSDASLIGEVLIKGSENNVYLIKKGEKTVYKIDLAGQNKTQTKPKVTKTNEKTTIAGYTCQKYLIEQDGNNIESWATNEIKIAKPKNASAAPNVGEFFIEGVDGFPLKMVIDAKGFKMTMTATEVKPEKLNASEFELPSGFAVKDFNMSAMFGN